MMVVVTSSHLAGSWQGKAYQARWVKGGTKYYDLFLLQRVKWCFTSTAQQAQRQQ